MSEENSDYELAEMLRALGLALDTRRKAHDRQDKPCPGDIVFRTGSLTDGDALSAAIKREIRISWEELRGRALKRLDDSVAQLSHQVAARIPPQQVEIAETEEAPCG